MLQFVELVSISLPAGLTVTLPWDVRQKSRFLARLDGGAECGFVLPRGSVLLDGAVARAESGELVRVVAAAEDLSVAQAPDPARLLRAAYHLGNRHVPVELGTTRLAYQHDHVLDDMVRDLGLVVSRERLPFAPESGAYKSNGQVHGGHRHESGGHGHGGHAHGSGGHSHGHARGGHSHG
jgi:urease accessory protein